MGLRRVRAAGSGRGPRLKKPVVRRNQESPERVWSESGDGSWSLVSVSDRGIRTKQRSTVFSFRWTRRLIPALQPDRTRDAGVAGRLHRARKTVKIRNTSMAAVQVLETPSQSQPVKD